MKNPTVAPFRYRDFLVMFFCQIIPIVGIVYFIVRLFKLKGIKKMPIYSLAETRIRDKRYNTGYRTNGYHYEKSGERDITDNEKKVINERIAMDIVACASFYIIVYLLGLIGQKAKHNSDYVSAFPNSNIEIFANKEALRDSLSRNGIGQLHPWKNIYDSQSISITDDYDFGAPNSKTTLRNSIGYQLESNDTSKVDNLLLYLKIFNSKDRDKAVGLFKLTSEKTFRVIGMKSPLNMYKSLDSGKPYRDSSGVYKVNLYRSKLSKIERWQLYIRQNKKETL